MLGTRLKVLAYPPPLRFSADEANQATQKWGLNCGPMSIAAACCMRLDEAYEAVSPFKGYMNPTHVSDALTRIGQEFVVLKGLRERKLCHGINRIQWEGPWLAPGKDKREAYKHTHWVAHFNGRVFCTATGYINWLSVAEWMDLLKDTDHDKLHVTHHYQFPRPCPPSR